MKSSTTANGGTDATTPCILRKIPGSREDVFSDRSIDLKSKRSLMNLLRLAADVEQYNAVSDAWGSRPFPEFLSSHLKIPDRLQPPLLALTLSPSSPMAVSTAYAIPRIHRHLISIGLFGPGFGSIIPKWGGMAEIAQVACRAGAVGGATYVLGRGVDEVCEKRVVDPALLEGVAYPLRLSLHGGETVETHWLTGSMYDLPTKRLPRSPSPATVIARSVSIVSSSLSSLFPISSEGAPPPAGTVIAMPTRLIHLESGSGSGEMAPVYLMVHSSNTGECPDGQCKYPLAIRFLATST